MSVRMAVVRVLAWKALRLRHELQNTQGTNGRLKLLLRERLTRIDELTAKLEQARSVNQRLEQECEHLAQLVAAPQPNAAILSQT